MRPRASSRRWTTRRRRSRLTASPRRGGHREPLPDDRRPRARRDRAAAVVRPDARAPVADETAAASVVADISAAASDDESVQRRSRSPEGVESRNPPPPWGRAAGSRPRRHCGAEDPRARARELRRGLGGELGRRRASLTLSDAVRGAVGWTCTRRGTRSSATAASSRREAFARHAPRSTRAGRRRETGSPGWASYGAVDPGEAPAVPTPRRARGSTCGAIFAGSSGRARRGRGRGRCGRLWRRRTRRSRFRGGSAGARSPGGSGSPSRATRRRSRRASSASSSHCDRSTTREGGDAHEETR